MPTIVVFPGCRTIDHLSLISEQFFAPFWLIFETESAYDWRHPRFTWWPHGLPCPTRSSGAVCNLSLDNTGECRSALPRFAVPLLPTTQRETFSRHLDCVSAVGTVCRRWSRLASSREIHGENTALASTHKEAGHATLTASTAQPSAWSADPGAGSATRGRRGSIA